MAEWIYVIRPTREGFKTEPTAEEMAIMSEHFEYLQGLMAGGKLVLAGPALDASFGVAAFEAEDEAEAQAIMKGDPAVANGVMLATLHPYRISLLRGRDS